MVSGVTIPVASSQIESGNLCISEKVQSTFIMGIDRLEIPLAKAEYLYSHSTEPGEGGDKQKFWREILGFDSAEAVREAILAQATPDNLEKTAPNSYGDRYQSIIEITGPSSRIRHIKTIWIVLSGETIARLVTAVPKSIRR